MKHLFTLFAALIFATSCMQNSNDQGVVYDLVGLSSTMSLFLVWAVKILLKRT